MKKIILASKSPRRQELIKDICDDFDVVVSKVDEIVPDEIAADETAAFLAKKKATDVSSKHPGSVVIGADTVVLLNSGEILGKPKDRADAKRMLSSLSGDTHTVVTGCCITDGVKTLSLSEKTTVEFYPLSDGEIERYLDTGEPFDKAGAYGIQGISRLFIKGIHGDFYTVMGLPVARLYRELTRFMNDEKNGS